MEVSLVMFKADGTRRDFPLTKPRLVIGRINSCDLRIPLSSVSRQHCEIRLNGDAVMVKDLGSSNGTFVNDIRITEQALEAGDAVTVGPVVFTLVLDGEPAEIEPVRTVLDGETGARRTEKMGRTQEMESGSLTSTGGMSDDEPGDSGDSLVTLDDDVAGDEDELMPLSDDEADGLESLASAADARSGGKEGATVSDDDVVDDDDVLDESDLLSDFDDGPHSSGDAETVDDSNDALPVLGDDDSAVMELLDPDEKPASKKPASPPKKDAKPAPSNVSDDSALPLLGDDDDDDEEDPISALEALASAGDEDDEPEEEKPAKDAKKRGRRRR